MTQQNNLQRAKEVSKQFTEYCNDGYNGGKEGLRCSTCDRKYRGEGAIIQLCPVCRADEIVTSTYLQAVEDKYAELYQNKIRGTASNMTDWVNWDDVCKVFGKETTLDEQIRYKKEELEILQSLKQTKDNN